MSVSLHNTHFWLEDGCSPPKLFAYIIRSLYHHIVAFTTNTDESHLTLVLSDKEHAVSDGEVYI